MLETFSYPTTRAAKAEFRPAFARGESVDIARAVAAIGRIQAVPTLLQILCDTTGMGLAAVARVTDTNWTACAIRDSVNSGITPGSQLDVNTTLCIEVKSTGVPIVTDRASSDPSYCNHPARALYNIESYISVPILLPNDEYFGNLFAIGQKPTMVSDPKILSMFEGFAKLIGYQLNEQLQIDEAHAALLDERAVSELREQFIGILGHDLRNPLQALFATTDLLSKRHGDEWSVKLTSRMKANVRRM